MFSKKSLVAILLAMTLCPAMAFGQNDAAIKAAAKLATEPPPNAKTEQGAPAQDILPVVKKAQPKENLPQKSFPDFASLRNEVLNLISGAKKRVWLTSEYLTDGEIATALFLAKYRKIDVKVLLGRYKSRSYMSRLKYLKNQKVKVYLRPRNFRIPGETAVMSDEDLLFINGNLDSLDSGRTYTGTEASPEQAQSYVEGFKKAADEQVPAVPVRMPLVGKSNEGRAYSSSTGRLESKTNKSSGQIRAAPRRRSPSPGGGYIYDGTNDPRPAGVATSLPKATIWEKQLRKGESGGGGK